MLDLRKLPDKTLESWATMCDDIAKYCILAIPPVFLGSSFGYNRWLLIFNLLCWALLFLNAGVILRNNRENK